jgi:hypothetical protein
MDTAKKLTVEQKGILLRELLSFLLSKNGKAKEDDVLEYFMNRPIRLWLGLQEDECIEQVETLATMCVKAEWLRKAKFWRTTEHGQRAYQRFTDPKTLFQEMAVQAAFRDARGSKKQRRISKIKLFVPLVIFSPCTILGFISNSQHLFLLATFSLIVLVLAAVLYDARTKSIILGRLLSVEFLILIATLYFDALFVTTSLGQYFYVYFFTTLISQVACVTLVFIFPQFFAKAFNYINGSKWLITIPVILLILLFGGKTGHGGLLRMLYGENIETIGFTLVYGTLMAFGLVFLLGGMVSKLITVGYYD